MPTVSMPASETHTVIPAKTTLRPDVAAAVASATAGSAPSRRPCR